MSLVREALEKAEREAAARAAREKGLPGSLSGGAGPYRSPRRPTKGPLLLAVAALALVALAVSGWMLVRSTSSRPAPVAPTATPAADPAAPAATEHAAGAAPAAEVASSPAPPPSAAPRAETPAAEPPPTPTTGTPASEPPNARPASRTFLRRAELADERALELGGIAWSETAPLAYLNGRLRGVGEVVEGYRVDAIEPQAVELSGDGGRLRITLR